MSPPLLATLVLVPISAGCCAAFARLMRSRNVGQAIRQVGPAGHATKAGTPTMGGSVVFALWALAVTALSIVITPTIETWFVLAAGGLFAGIGVADDLISLRKRRSLGLSGRWKILLSTAAVVLLFLAFRETFEGPLLVPFASRTLSLPLPATFALGWFVFLGTTNGMNLADGLDGLAGGIALLIVAGIAILRPAEVNLALCLPLVGILLGFLWLNVHPAKLFLGDTGAFFLGGVVAALALAGGLAFLLPILAGVLVLEVGSVIAQVTARRLFGRRVFRMAPFHHHFESHVGVNSRSLFPAVEWTESKITTRFWIAEAAFVLLALLAGAPWA